MKKFEVFKSTKAKWYQAGWYFHLRAMNGKIILASEAYRTAWGAKRGINAVRRAAKQYRFKEFRGTDRRWRFNLVAANNKVVGVSQGYERIAGARNGMRSVVVNSADAPVITYKVKEGKQEVADFFGYEG